MTLVTALYFPLKEKRSPFCWGEGGLLGAPNNCGEKGIMPLTNFFLKNLDSLSPRVSVSASSSFGSTLLLLCTLYFSAVHFFISALLLVKLLFFISALLKASS